MVNKIHFKEILIINQEEITFSRKVKENKNKIIQYKEKEKCTVRYETKEKKKKRNFGMNKKYRKIKENCVK